MKKSLLLFAFTFCFTFSSFAQEQTKLLKFKGIKGDMGLTWDRYKNMSLDWMKMRTVQDGAFSDDLSQMSEGYTFYSSLGGNIGTQLLFTAPSLGNDFAIPEVRLGVNMTLGKEAIVDYNSYDAVNSQSLMYCFVENETRLNAEVVWRIGDTKKVTFYGGLGANVSGSFNNDLFVFDNYLNNRNFAGNNFEAANRLSSTENVFTGKSVFYQRVYVPVGVDLKIFRYLQATMEYKFGGGIEEIASGPVNTFRTGEFNIGMRLNLAKNNTPSLLDYFN